MLKLHLPWFLCNLLMERILGGFRFFGCLVLLSFESDSEHGFFIVVKSHLAIVLIVIFVLKERNPLGICVYSTVVDNLLRYADTPYLVSAIS